jgi:two-component system KDP operon response regulator KdpE
VDQSAINNRSRLHQRAAKPLAIRRRTAIIVLMARVLVIDDNQLDRKISRDSLTSAGFTVEEAADGAAGLKLLYENRPDLVLLDVVMPAMDGWTVCQRIRELCDIPIIMLTSLNREEEMVHGLNAGADDFVSKPISPAHLNARVSAVLRRTRSPSPPAPDLLYDDGTLRIDAARHEVSLNGAPVDLTPTEFRLLVTLAGQPGRVQTFATLLAEVWGPEYTDDIDFLRVYVWRLRKKLEPDADKPRWLLTERGFGYRFAEAGR